MRSLSGETQIASTCEHDNPYGITPQPWWPMAWGFLCGSTRCDVGTVRHCALGNQQMVLSLFHNTPHYHGDWWWGFQSNWVLTLVKSLVHSWTIVAIPISRSYTWIKQIANAATRIIPFILVAHQLYKVSNRTYGYESTNWWFGTEILGPTPSPTWPPCTDSTRSIVWLAR